VWFGIGTELVFKHNCALSCEGTYRSRSVEYWLKINNPEALRLM